MTATKREIKQRDSETRVGEIAEQFEHAFLAGLGALSNAQKAGVKTFDSLVKEGEEFRAKTSKRTESLIGDVQDAIRGMTDDAQSKATGLLDQVRGVSKLEKLHDVFDSRVAGAMDRLNIPSQDDIDAINKKLNKILRKLDGQEKTASKKPRATAKRKTSKKAAAKPVAHITAVKPAAEKVTKEVTSKE